VYQFCVLTDRVGILSNFSRSWKKSSKLRELELKIAPPGRGVTDIIADVRNSLNTGANERAQALEEFLDLCQADDGVRQVMETEQLTREDLRHIYRRLAVNGLGQWVHGHYVALSTIAYAEPLQYLAKAERGEVARLEIAGKLLAYWENRIAHGDLLRQVR
jgi:hypothetical protein